MLLGIMAQGNPPSVSRQDAFPSAKALATQTWHLGLLSHGTGTRPVWLCSSFTLSETGAKYWLMAYMDE